MAELTITGTPYPQATVGVAYSFVPTVAGGTAPYTFYLEAQAAYLPAGLSFSTTTGAITGSPTAAELYFTTRIAVVDAAGNQRSLPFTVTVSPLAGVPTGVKPARPAITVTPGAQSNTVAITDASAGSMPIIRRYVYRQIGTNFTRIGMTGGTSYTDANLIGGVSYAYKATSASAVGESDYSFVVSGIAGGGGVAPTLQSLLLSSTAFTSGTAAGALLATITGQTSGSTVAIASADTSGVFAVNGAGTQLLAGMNFPASGASSPNVQLTETLAGATGSPKTTSVGVTISAGGGVPTNAIADTTGTPFTDAGGVIFTTA